MDQSLIRRCKRCPYGVVPGDMGYEKRLCDDCIRKEEMEKEERDKLKQKQRQANMAKGARAEKRRKRVARNQLRQLGTNAKVDLTGVKRALYDQRSRVEICREKKSNALPDDRKCPLCGVGPIIALHRWLRVYYQGRKTYICRKCYFNQQVRDALQIEKPLPAHYHTSAKAQMPQDLICPSCGNGPIPDGKQWVRRSIYFGNTAVCRKCHDVARNQSSNNTGANHNADAT